MGWHTDRSKILMFCLSVLGLLLSWMGSVVYADVNDLKLANATKGQALEEINRRLERIENKLDALNDALLK